MLNSAASAPTKVVAVDKQLFSILKDLRKKIGNAKGVPPYAVFSENSLSEMATIYPCNLDELKNIQGVGEGKARKFGAKMVEAIEKYVEENDIDRPQDMVFKSVANKSALKVYIIQRLTENCRLKISRKQRVLRWTNCSKKWSGL